MSSVQDLSPLCLEGKKKCGEERKKIGGHWGENSNISKVGRLHAIFGGRGIIRRKSGIRLKVFITKGRPNL